VAEREIDEDLILSDPETGAVVSLNVVAGFVWELCDGTRDTTAIADAIAATFDRPHEEVAADIQEILEELTGAGLVQ
jgi:hypothetical protein